MRCKNSTPSGGKHKLADLSAPSLLCSAWEPQQLVVSYFDLNHCVICVFVVNFFFGGGVVLHTCSMPLNFKG